MAVAVVASQDSIVQPDPITDPDNKKAVPKPPPLVKSPYSPKDALDDIPGVAHALDLFLASRMVESEEYCDKTDPNKERLYMSTAYGIIQCVKALMSYADDDILAGIKHTKQGNHIAIQHRKKAASLTSRLAGYVVTSLNTTGIGLIKSMTPVERHAELVYAESLFEKSLLGIIYSGDWLAFIKEALNMRTTFNIYRSLYKYVTTMDAASPTGYDDSIDAHFRSGVYLGTGMSSLVITLMPAKVLTVVELFGYHGDRTEALSLLCKAGGWTSDSDEPTISESEEGVRRSICDMSLMVFHLFLSDFTFEGVDISMAEKIIYWNAKRYPDGVFFLFGRGRLALIRSQPKEAIGYYTRAMEVQTQYRNLHHLSYWEMAVANLALWDMAASLECWKVLEKESTWSKAVYTYGMAVCLIEGSAQSDEARSWIEKVPDCRQKVAGKSIPAEKFVARKARKFLDQGWLILPAMELAYMFLALSRAPGDVLVDKMLVAIKECLKVLNEKDSSSKGYWDDWTLARFLEGVCMRYVAYPDPHALILPGAPPVAITQEEAGAASIAAFEAVFENGPKIELDHYVVYHAHYELGRLLACKGNVVEARNHFDLVLSGKYLEVGPSGRKGRYSMESALHMRAYAAMDALGKRPL
ncbi:uncharacterized protein BT62DRAFT_984650 [Guyanagaster necrorhizus]|uniref:Tetratricopeptide repeat protein 39B n=1 Tax=Guyanagaster necrorhizus TaxID=856835 RepID=A0A9P7W2Q0_9AGAR|nr:uncharacterized protein BT62DRAFT_984650 [Guyanagaster necrorhizus MCA 3950]KAG7451588.1 hypothetical protein BT62DRAFT_984650 [Guyanagaster necrorhizus MCA 3950]